MVNLTKDGGEGTTTLQVHTNGRETFIETADNIEEECMVGDVLTEVTKGVHHALEALVVVGDGEVTLEKTTQACLPISKEPPNGGRDGMCNGTTFHHGAGEVDGDGAEMS